MNPPQAPSIPTEAPTVFMITKAPGWMLRAHLASLEFNNSISGALWDKPTLLDHSVGGSPCAVSPRLPSPTPTHSSASRAQSGLFKASHSTRTPSSFRAFSDMERSFSFLLWTRTEAMSLQALPVMSHFPSLQERWVVGVSRDVYRVSVQLALNLIRASNPAPANSRLFKKQR